MVKMPPETTLLTDEPEIMPFSAEDTTATLAGPPRRWPSSREADLHHVVAAAGAIEQAAEQHVDEDRAGGDTQRDAVHAFGGEPQVRQQPVQSDTPLCDSTSGM